MVLQKKMKPPRVNAQLHQAQFICVTMPLIHCFDPAAITASNKKAGLLDRMKVRKKLCQHWYIAVIVALIVTDEEGTWN